MKKLKMARAYRGAGCCSIHDPIAFGMRENFSVHRSYVELNF